MTLQVLHPDVVRELLQGHQSNLQKIAEVDLERKRQIEKRTCPECGRSLLPRVPLNTSEIFDDSGVLYVAHCPAHGTIT